MDDVFYFNKENISLNQLSAVAKANNYPVLLVEDKDVLQVSMPNDTNIQIFKMDRNEFDDDYPSGMKSSFCIAVNVKSFDHAFEFLRLILKKFGGWVGKDEDEFPVIDLSQ